MTDGDITNGGERIDLYDVYLHRHPLVATAFASYDWLCIFTLRRATSPLPVQ